MDELYVIARRVLLNALEALGEHRSSTILVGAQAVYLHTGSADIRVAEFTSDADIAFDPAFLAKVPPLEQLLVAAGFQALERAIGSWVLPQSTQAGTKVNVQLDLLVPASLSPGPGRRAARLTGHDSKVARKVKGLEGALVDVSEHQIKSLEPALDDRSITLKVAGPGALLVAKMFKIAERQGSARANDKDALDVFRLLRAVATQKFAQHLRLLLNDSRTHEPASTALESFASAFASRAGFGSLMAARATQLLMDKDEVTISCEFLANELLRSL